MEDIINNKKILEDLYNSSLIFFQRTFLAGNGKFSNFYKKILDISDSFPVCIDGEILTSSVKTNNRYIYINPKQYKAVYEKLKSLPLLPFYTVQNEMFNLILPLVKSNTPADNTYVAIDDFSLKDIKNYVSEFEKIIYDKSLVYDIQKILYNLRKHIKAFKNNQCIGKAINKFLNCLDEYIKSGTNNGLTDEQKKAIAKWVKIRSIYLEGVPGASKTFISASSLVLSATVDTTIISPKAKSYNYLIIALTYKALEEFVKKILEIFRYSCIKDFLANFVKKIGCKEKENMGIKSINLYLHFSQFYASNLTQNGKNLLDSFKEKIGKKLFSGVNTSLMNCQGCRIKGTKNNCIKISIPISNRVNDDEINFHLYVLKKFLDIDNSINGECDNTLCLHCITGMHIEEASQIPFYSMILILRRLKDSYFFKNVLDTRGIWRFSFSGDPLQLGPIYQKPDGSMNFELINLYYNIFSYFFTSKKNRIYLKESFRVCETILECVEKFYRDVNEKGIKAYKKNCCERIQIKNTNISKNDKFYNILRECLKEFPRTCILRIEYTCNKKFRRKNDIEIYIAKTILNLLDYQDFAILAPFRDQETLLTKQINSSDVLIGTVDKLQGDERDCVIFLTTSNDKEYIRETKNFIFNPNRLNVALTRTKRLFVIIHSSDVKDVAFTDFDIDFDRKVKYTIANLLVSNPYFRNSTNDLSTFEKFLKMYDVNEGMYIFQKIVEKTKRQICSSDFDFINIKGVLTYYVNS